ncbi:hypothetical protein TcasGA2_TC001689 [Tribolium castaneum]|uniref:Integrase catalytic domain-containing protein n=1 Tax=Tribolium castaneum TaxID=7070 RepID=D6W8G4_TRICA|nr:hypothetical protein TcasGA2_TC001689 [Tribolium castaneum]
MTIVEKKDGTVRICLDARMINSKMIADCESPPASDELLRRFHGIRYMSTIKMTVDRGGEFKNNTLENFCNLHKIELHYTTSKNSNSNFPVERFHSTLAEQIRCLKLERPNENTNTLMKYVIVGYNNSIHSTTNFTPFEVIKGHVDSLNPFELTEEKATSNYIQNHKEKAKLLYDKIKNKLIEKKEMEHHRKNDDLKNAKLQVFKEALMKSINCRHKLKLGYLL